MKKIILIFILLAVLFISVKFSDDNLSYVAIGDGLAKGINYNNYKGKGYSYYLYGYLKENDKFNIYIDSFTDENIRITDLINNINNNISTIVNNKKITIQNAIKNSDILTISIGTNEILYKYSTNIGDAYMYSYIDECINDYEKLLKLITKLNSNNIYVLGIYNPTNDMRLDKFIMIINDKINDLCDKYKIKYIDTYSLFKNNKHLIYDKNNFYPNQDGYKLIANSIKNKLNLSK